MFVCFFFYKFVSDKCFWTSDIDKDNFYLLKTDYVSNTLLGILYTWSYGILYTWSYKIIPLLDW